MKVWLLTIRIPWALGEDVDVDVYAEAHDVVDRIENDARENGTKAIFEPFTKGCIVAKVGDIGYAAYEQEVKGS
jgi:hypothetical protein